MEADSRKLIAGACRRARACAVRVRATAGCADHSSFYFRRPTAPADMQSRVSRVESESSACAPPIAETRAALAALEEQKARLVEDVQRLRRGKEVGQAALHALTQQIAAIKQAKATLNSDHGSNVPRVRHSLSLYASISSIRWDYDSDAVAGCACCIVCHFPSARSCAPTLLRSPAIRAPPALPPADVAPPHGAPVKPFHLDPRALSEKAIADALWASIGEAYGLPEARA